MTSTTTSTRTTFTSAANDFLTVVGGIVDQWDDPGLGEWSVKELVGHAARAFLTIETYARPGSTTDEPTIGSAGGYFAAALQGVDHGLIAQRGREAAGSLGEDPRGAVEAIAGRVTTLVDKLPDNTVMDLPWGTMRLAEYLTTRLFELAVHTEDLRSAIGDRSGPPKDVQEAALAVISTMYVDRGDAATLLRALTGRVPTSTIETIL